MMLKTRVINSITTALDQHVTSFIAKVAHDFDISEQSLLELWDKHNKSEKSTKTKIAAAQKKKRALTGYQMFMIHIRPTVVEEMPDLTFGQISSEISKRWRRLSPTEQEIFMQKAIDASKEDRDASKAADDMGRLKDDMGRLKDDMGELKDDMGELKDDMGELKDDRMGELRDDRIDTPFDNGMLPVEDEEENNRKKRTATKEHGKKANVSSNNRKKSSVKKDDHTNPFSKLNVKELSAKCKEQGIKSSGKKEDLITRLLATVNTKASSDTHSSQSSEFSSSDQSSVTHVSSDGHSGIFDDDDDIEREDLFN